MQLIRKDMKKLQVWRHQATDTYLGMEEGNWVKHRVLYGRVLPAESRLAHALYGSRVGKDDRNLFGRRRFGRGGRDKPFPRYYATFLFDRLLPAI